MTMTLREKIAREILYKSGIFDSPAEIKANMDHPLVRAAYKEADRRVDGECARTKET